jgi:hypothetical protein
MGQSVVLAIHPLHAELLTQSRCEIVAASAATMDDSIEAALRRTQERIPSMRVANNQVKEAQVARWAAILARWMALPVMCLKHLKH